jgi:hypothetical protein
MSMEKVQEKLLRRLTSPVEILYDVSTHWFVLLFMISLGTLLTWAKVASEPPVFECTATVVLKPNEILLAEDVRRPTPPPRGIDLTFIGEQLSLLQSDSVMDKVAMQIGDDPILEQEEDPLEGRELGFIQRAYRSIEKGVVSLIESLKRQPEGTLGEQRRQKAKAAFRERSYVQHDSKPNAVSNIIKLGVLGTHRNRLKDEILVWIDAYRSRIDEISNETFLRLFDERTDYWVKQEKDSKQQLDKFRKENADVSVERQNLNREKVIRLKMSMESLQKDFTGVGPLGPSGTLIGDKLVPLGPPSPEEDRLNIMKKRLDQLRGDLAVLRAKSPPTSEKIKQAEEGVKNLEEEVRKLEDPLMAAAAQEAAEPKPEVDSKAKDEEKEQQREKERTRTREEVLTRRIKFLDNELNAAIAEQAALDEKVMELTGLIDNFKRAGDLRRQYQTLMDQKNEQKEARKIVDIQIQDRPLTSVEPVGAYYAKVALGALAGALGGIFLAFNLEFFCRRIRFKKDVEDELGLTVVGVIPEN